MPPAQFMATLGEHGVPVIDYPVEDLREEQQALRRQ
jgi:predicted HTH domain antitoxin